MAKRKNHPGMIRKRGPSYQVVLRVAGKRHQFTVRGVKADAERFAREKFDELSRKAERGALGMPVGVTFSTLLSEFEKHHLPGLATRTQESYRDTLKPVRLYFVEGLGDPALEDIRAAHIRHYLTWRRTHGPQGNELEKPLHGRTLERDRAILHKMFALADRLEYREGNPVTRVDRPKYDQRQAVILTAEQFEKLLTAAEPDPMLWLWLLTLNESGIRSESVVLRLRWENIDLADGFIHVTSDDEYRSKTGDQRWVPLTPRLRAAMREHFAAYRFADYDGKQSPWVFHHTQTLRRGVAGEPFVELRTKAYKAARSVGIKCGQKAGGWVPHDLRHRRATTWIAEGKSPALVQEAMGHKTFQTTERYIHLAKEHLRALVDEPAGPARDAVNR